MYINPPTSLSVERVRARDQPASPSAINLTPLNSLSPSANQPASTPNLVAASLQARQLAYYLLKGSAFGCESSPQPATGCHRMSDSLASTPSQTSINPPKSNQNMRESWIDAIFKVPELRTSLFGSPYYEFG